MATSTGKWEKLELDEAPIGVPVDIVRLYIQVENMTNSH